MSRRGNRPRSKLSGVHKELAEILGADSLAKLMNIAGIRRAWPEIVGPMMAARSEPLQIEPLPEGGVCLWVAVDHPIIAQQIRILRDDIRKACYRKAGISELHKISTRIQPGAGIQAKAPKPKARRLSFAEKRRLALDVAAIKDRKLRRAAFEAHVAQLAFGNTDTEEK